jgi:hypothetical protein
VSIIFVLLAALAAQGPSPAAAPAASSGLDLRSGWIARLRPADDGRPGMITRKAVAAFQESGSSRWANRRPDAVSPG